MAGVPEQLYFEKICGRGGLVDVVFVHGLRGSPADTWTCEPCAEADGGFWPKWLEADLPGSNAYTVGYPSSFFVKWAKKELNLYERAKTVLELFAARGLGDRPLVFVGHSLGGLLTKQILRVASESTDKAWTDVATNCRKVFFIATPHSGSSLATILKTLAVGFASAHVKALEQDSSELDELNEFFRNHASKIALSTHVYYEVWKTGKAAIVVDKKSADPGLTGVQAIAIEADHIGIAQPKGREALLYLSVNRHLKEFIGSVTPPDVPTRNEAFGFEREPMEEYGTDRRDLHTKLTAAGREHEYQFANERQNRFARQYYRSGLIRHAKDHYDGLLADIDQRFNALIYHELICKGASSAEIAAAIQTQVVEPLQDKYSQNRATAVTIMNALYFLTERCHVRWDPP